MSEPHRPPVRRLGYLVSRYPAISHTFILREVRNLRRMGFDIRVASVNPPDRPVGALTKDERAEAGDTYYVKPSGVPGALAAQLWTLSTRPFGWLRGMAFALSLAGFDLRKAVLGLFYFLEAAMVGRWMRRNRLDHLHVHFATPASTVALIATRIYPVTTSITVHGPDEFYDAPGYHLAEKIRGASFLCCIGHYARSQLMKLSPATEWGKLEISPLGVDLAAFSPRPFRDRPAPFEILCVGRLVPAKGQQILLTAVETLWRKGRDVRLRLVGDGPDRNSLEEAVRSRDLEDRVAFEGAVDQDRIRAFYQAADVFALASFAEGIPVVLMEAMAMEIPCVTTCITGIPELIRHEVDGLLVPASDETALAGALERLMDDPGLRRRLGQNGRQRVREKFDLETNTRRLAEIFERRIPERPC